MWGAGRGAQCVLADTQTHGSFISCSDRWLGKRVLPGSGPVCPQPPGPRSSHRASGARSRGPEGGPGGFLPQGSMVLPSVCRRRGAGETVCRNKWAERKREKLLPDDRGEGRLSAPRSDSASLPPREMQQASLGPPTAESVCSAPSPTPESPVLACPHLGIPREGGEGRAAASLLIFAVRTARTNNGEMTQRKQRFRERPGHTAGRRGADKQMRSLSHRKGFKSLMLPWMCTKRPNTAPNKALFILWVPALPTASEETADRLEHPKFRGASGTRDAFQERAAE